LSFKEPCIQILPILESGYLLYCLGLNHYQMYGLQKFSLIA
jgi:hypothetical protein